MTWIVAVILGLILVLISFVGWLFAAWICNWGIEVAQEAWNSGVITLKSLLTLDFTAFSADANASIETAYSYIEVVGVALVACLAFAEVAKSLTTMLDTKRIETAVKAFLRCAICSWLVLNVRSLLTQIYHIFMYTAESVLGGSTAGQITNMQEIIRNGNDDIPPPSWDNILDLFNWNFEGDNSTIFDAVLVPISYIICIIIIVVLIVTVLSTLFDCVISMGTRFLRVWVHVAFSALAVSTYTCSETSFVGKQFTKSFISVSAETLIGAIILLVFPSFLTGFMSIWTSPGITLGTSIVTDYIFGAIGISCAFNIFKQFMKQLDQFSSQMLGLGGA